jgi:hypothetical protein
MTAESKLRVADIVWGSLPELLLPLIIGQRPLKFWVFVATFILRLNILRAYDGFVDLGCQMLRLAREEVSLCSPGAGPRSSCLVVVKVQHSAREW